MLAVVEGFSGLGKSDLARQVQRAWHGPSVSISATEAGTDADSLLLDMALGLEEAGSGTMANSANGDLRAGLANLFNENALVIIDDFEDCLDEDTGTPSTDLVNLLRTLDGRHGCGRLLLISTREPLLSPVPVERIRLSPPSAGEAETHLAELLALEGLVNEVAPESRTDVVNWLGRNPRAIRSFVACLRYEPLEQLMELRPDQWALEEVASPALVAQLEEGFVKKTLGRLAREDLGLLQGLATYRRPFPIDAIRAFRGQVAIERQIDSLRSRFLLSRSGSRYSLNPVARRIALRQLRSGPRSWIRAHSRSADYYLPRALQGVSRVQLLPGTQFVEARYHLLNAERASDFQALAARYRGALLRNYRHARVMPSARNEQSALLETLSSILDDDIRGYAELRALLATLLLSRGAPGDEIAALRQTRLAVRESRDPSVWRIHVDLSARNETPLALEVIGKQALSALSSAAAAQTCVMAVQALYLQGDAPRALNLVNEGLDKVAILDRQPLYTTGAFILDREDRRREALELLAEGYVELGPLAHNYYKLFEEAVFLCLQSRNGGFLRRLKSIVHDGPLRAGQEALCEAALLQIDGNYRDAAVLGEQYSEYFALIAQSAFCWIVVGDVERAVRVLEGARLVSTRVSSWIHAVVYLRAKRNSDYRRWIVDCVPVSELEDEYAWFSAWNEVPASLGPYPAFYFPVLPSSLTGLDRDLYRANPNTPADLLHDGEAMTLCPSKLLHEKDESMTESETRSFDLGIITVIPEQTRIIRQFLQSGDGFSEWKVRGQRWVMSGTIPFVETSGGPSRLSVISTQTLDQGNQSAAKAYDVLKAEGTFSLVVLADIAGGIHENVKLGDVLVANDVIYYDRRAITEMGDEHRGKHYTMPAEILNTINRFLVLNGQPCVLRTAEPGVGEDSGTFRVHVGPIGSGEAVLKYADSSTRAWLKSVNSKTLGVEMEAAGVLAADQEEGRDSGTYGALVVRGISDHADEEKDDSWRVRACQHVLDTILAIAPAAHETLLS